MTAGDPAPASYFYLSHARPPSGEGEYWVRIFFRELQAEVAHQAPPDTTFGPGFADFLPPGPERDAAVAHARSTARVLVPLYSPAYLDGPETREERATFLQRDRDATGDPQRHGVQAVLWTPVPAGHVSDLSRALELGHDVPEYAQLGLQTMLRLRQHREGYDEILRRLAARIVEAAHRPTPAPTGPATAAPATATADGTPFVVAVIAPTSDLRPPLRQAACYGLRSTLWRPYRGSHDAQPVTEYTAQVVRQFRMPPRVVDFGADDHMLEMYPGVILIDPWILARNGGKALVAAAVNTAALRQWVTLVVVVDRHDTQFGPRGSDLAREAMSMASGAPGSKITRDATEFERTISKVVARNRRSFLSERPPAPDGPPPPSRPRHTEPGRTRGPDTPSDPDDPGTARTAGEAR